MEQGVVATPDEATQMVARLGGQVALKVILPGAARKSDVGGVRLHLADPLAVKVAAREMAQQIQAATGREPSGFVVQRMAPPGVEMLVGMVNDPIFGPTVACGTGGTLVELLKDVSVRLAPLTRGEAAGMVRELRKLPPAGRLPWRSAVRRGRVGGRAAAGGRAG